MELVPTRSREWTSISRYFRYVACILIRQFVVRLFQKASTSTYSSVNPYICGEYFFYCLSVMGYTVYVYDLSTPSAVTEDSESQNDDKLISSPLEPASEETLVEITLRKVKDGSLQSRHQFGWTYNWNDLSTICTECRFKDECTCLGQKHHVTLWNICGVHLKTGKEVYQEITRALAVLAENRVYPFLDFDAPIRMFGRESPYGMQSRTEKIPYSYRLPIFATHLYQLLNDVLKNYNDCLYIVDDLLEI